MPNLLPRWVRGARYVALWTVVAAFFAVQVRLDYAYLGQPISWLEAFGLALAEWYAWALVAPILWWVALRFPFERGAWLRPVLVHLPVTLAVTVLATLIESVVVPLTGVTRRPSQMADLTASLLTAWLISGVCHAIVHARAAQDRRARAAELESHLARARLDVLRSQLQPHFLFNTLNAVTTLMHRDVDAAETMLTRLADLLRLTLDLRDRQEIALREELELTDAYLAIQQIRFGDRLRVARDVDPGLYDALVPTMILQPLVENAIDHGIARRAGTGSVELVAARRDDELRLLVRDDGPGLDDDPRPEGVGLTNTRERLAQLYGEAGALSITPLGPPRAASVSGVGVERVREPARGVEVELKVPLRFRGEDGGDSR